MMYGTKEIAGLLPIGYFSLNSELIAMDDSHAPADLETAAASDPACVGWRDKSFENKRLAVNVTSSSGVGLSLTYAAMLSQSRDLALHSPNVWRLIRSES
jgi:hypothetical protein